MVKPDNPRIQRGDMQQVKSITEHLRQLQKIWKAKPNEAETVHYYVFPILQSLGYEVLNPLEVIPEYDLRGDRVDFLVKYNGQPLFFLEAKSLGENLNFEPDTYDKQRGKAFVKQVVGYVAHLQDSDPLWLVLTNGLVWHFHYLEPRKRANYSALHILQLHLDDPDFAEHIGKVLAPKQMIDPKRALRAAQGISTKQREKAEEERQNQEIRQAILHKCEEFDWKSWQSWIEFARKRDQDCIPPPLIEELSDLQDLPTEYTKRSVYAETLNEIRVWLLGNVAVPPIPRDVGVTKGQKRKKAPPRPVPPVIYRGESLSIHQWTELLAYFVQEALSRSTSIDLIQQAGIKIGVTGNGFLNPRKLASGYIVDVHGSANDNELKIKRLLELAGLAGEVKFG